MSFVRLFAAEGVAITLEEARAPMGLPKRQHIEALGRLPRVADAWREAQGSRMTAADVDRLYQRLMPMNIEAVREHAALVPGAAELAERLRRAGLKVGSTTGYDRATAQIMANLAASQGFIADNLACADDLPQTRPSPMAIYRSLLDLNVWPAAAVVKVDDTVPGLLEGRHAGCWTIAVAVSGNETGLSAQQWAALSAPQREACRQQAAARLTVAQPDAIVDTVADLWPLLEDIDRRLGAGERPPPHPLP